MAVSFAYDLDDLLDVTMRSIRARRELGRARWRTALLSGLVGGVIMFLLFLDRADSQPLLITLATMIAVTAIAYWWWPVAVARRIRRYLVESWQPGEHTCDVRLHEHALRVVQPGLETNWPWSDVVALRETGDDIEIWSLDKLTVVRGRGFASGDDRAAFITAANDLMQRHRRNASDG